MALLLGVKMNTRKIKYQAQELLTRLETLEAYVKVAKGNAELMVKVCEESDNHFDVNKLKWSVSAHELPRLANLCSQSATRFDYAMDLLLELNDPGR